jgi:hypothetical protein
MPGAMRTSVERAKNTMNASEARAARRRAGIASSEERLRKDPEMAQRIEEQLAHLQLEQRLMDAFASRANAELPPLDSDPNI